MIEVDSEISLPNSILFPQATPLEIRNISRGDVFIMTDFPCL